MQHSLGRLTLTAALSGLRVKNVAFCRKSLPTHEIDCLVWLKEGLSFVLSRYRLDPKDITAHVSWKATEVK